jgi:Protein of unknown function (DUF1449)
MNEIYQAITHFPGIVPSVFLSVLLLLVLIAFFGLLDIHHTGTDWDLHHDADGVTDGGWLAALGFGRVPVFIIASSVIFIWWMITILGQLHLLPLIAVVPGWISGSVLLITAFVLSVRLSIYVIRPLKPFFIRPANATRPVDFVGRPCKIITGTVDERFGQAEVIITNGAPHVLQVFAHSGNSLTRGSTALILSFDKDRKRYEVESYDP